MKSWRRSVFWVAVAGMAVWTIGRQVEPWRRRFRIAAGLREQWANSGGAVFAETPVRRRLREALSSAGASNERVVMYLGDDAPSVMARNTHVYLSMILRPQPVPWTSAPAEMGADWVCSLDWSPAARAAVEGYERVSVGTGVSLYRRPPEAAQP